MVSITQSYQELKSQYGAIVAREMLLACFEQKSLRRNIVVAGDFNLENLGNTAFATLDFQEYPQPTFPSWNPKRALDHILCDPVFHITQYGLIPGRSDHLGLYADIKHSSL